MSSNRPADESQGVSVTLNEPSPVSLSPSIESTIAPLFSNIMELQSLDQNLLLKAGFMSGGEAEPWVRRFFSQTVISHETGRQLLTALAEVYQCELTPQRPYSPTKPNASVPTTGRREPSAPLDARPTGRHGIEPAPVSLFSSTVEQQPGSSNRKPHPNDTPVLLRQREEEENRWKRWIADKLGKPKEYPVQVPESQRIPEAEAGILRQMRQTQQLLNTLIARKNADIL